MAQQEPIVWHFPPSPFEKQKEEVERGGQLKPLPIKKENTSESFPKHELMIVEQPITWKMPEPLKDKRDEYFNIELNREPMTTFCITPNNSPENKYSSSRYGDRFSDREEFGVFNPRHKEQNTDVLLNTISGLYQKFYAPHRVRFTRNGVRIKMNDAVSYKIAIEDGLVKFYMAVPKRWEKNFLSAIRQDWGLVDITEVDNKVIEFDPKKAQIMEVRFRHHYALSLKHEGGDFPKHRGGHNSATKDTFLASITSLASTLGEGDKVLIDYNIEPTNDKWKVKASKKMQVFKKGKPATREDTFTLWGMVLKLFDVLIIAAEEAGSMIEEAMGVEKKDGAKAKEEKELFKLNYSEPKIHANSKGYKVSIHAIAQSEDVKKAKHALKNIETAYSTFDGDNQYMVSHVKPKDQKTIKKIIQAVETNEPLLNGKPKDVYFEKELKSQLKLPSKETLSEYEKTIAQDAFTRTEVAKQFLNSEYGAIPFATTLDKVPKTLSIPGYEREEWTEKGRYVLVKELLDDRSTATMIFGGMGSGKTSFIENQICYTFGAHITDEEQWKRESKSVVAFDVADGEMIARIWSRLPDFQKKRTIILNHGNYKNPIAVNNADLNEYNSEILQDDDFASTLAEMEARLVLQILGAEKTFAMDRWFLAAMKCVHSVNKDWGYIEALRILVDDVFREEMVIPFIQNRRLKKEMENYSRLKDGKKAEIVETVQNRFTQLESDPKLWDCIAQKPIRDEDGKVALNFRKMMDGDEGGAYLVLIHIPNNGPTELFRRFIFAHYFTKIWYVLKSRDNHPRAYRPETLIVVDEVHQIINIPLIGKMFIELFKEPRKYSGRYMFSLHGWSSLADAGRNLEGKIKQSIMDNGCNLVMLKGGEDAFKSLSNFLYPMTVDDFNNLMQMKYCGIFAIRSGHKNHVMQAKMIPSIDKKESIFKEYSKIDTDFLMKFNSPYGYDREKVRDDCFARSESLIDVGFEGSEKPRWMMELEKDGMNDMNPEDE